MTGSISNLLSISQDVTAQIINQCMYGPYSLNDIHTDNGGWWSWGAEYSEGWFYLDGAASKREIGSRAAAASKMARSVTIPEHMHPDADPHVIHLLNGTAVKAERVVYITTITGEDGKNKTKITKDLNYT
jgi:hypothetical protein